MIFWLITCLYKRFCCLWSLWSPASNQWRFISHEVCYLWHCELPDSHIHSCWFEEWDLLSHLLLILFCTFFCQTCQSHPIPKESIKITLIRDLVCFLDDVYYFSNRIKSISRSCKLFLLQKCLNAAGNVIYKLLMFFCDTLTRI